MSTSINDCDDTEPLAWTDNIEFCDGIDNNCSGDESDSVHPLAWYADLDGDGLGDHQQYDVGQPSCTVRTTRIVMTLTLRRLRPHSCGPCQPDD